MRFHKSFGSILTAQLKSSYIFVGLAVSDINEGSQFSCYEIKKKNYESMYFFLKLHPEAYYMQCKHVRYGNTGCGVFKRGIQN